MRRLLSALLALPLLASAAAAADAPNIVLLLVDDLGKEDLGFEGTAFYETPRIDALAARSMRFDRGYSACQVCSPSRAAIQTGKYPPRTGVTDYIGGGNQPGQWRRNTVLLPAPYAGNLAREEVTIAEALKDGGYRTFFAGKWHLGGDGHTPTDQGYDINKGGYGYGTPPGGFHAPFKNAKLSDSPPGTELPHRLAQETADFITQTAPGEPYFAMLSFYSVHAPIQCSKARWEKFRNKAEGLGLTDRTAPRFLFDRVMPVRQVQDHPVYAGMMAALDDAVGQVLDAVEASGEADNTVIIFTSDNGGVSSGDGFATACLPMRGGKGRQWEGGIRQPLTICVPGTTDDGGATDVPAIGMDFYPTLLELAGLPARPEQHVDGVSLVPAIGGEPTEELKSRPLFWHYPHYGNQGGEPSAIAMDGDWKLIRYFEDGRHELYDLAADIGETNDLAESNPDKVRELSGRLDAWLAEVGAKYPTKNPRFDQAEYDKLIESRIGEGTAYRDKEHARFLDPDFEPKGGWWDLRGKK